MAPKISHKQPISLLKSSFNTLINNPAILFPFCILAFIQILTLGIIFFAPRQPLSVFFGPIIVRLHGEIFLHYPFNFVVLTQWFQKTQIPIYILCSTYFAGCTISIIDLINRGKKVNIKTVFRKTLSSYIHLLTAGIILVAIAIGFFGLYDLLIRQALTIRSTSGIYFLIKQVIVRGAPYLKLMLSVFATSIFAFVIPIIIIEKERLFPAIALNFKSLRRSFWFVFLIIFLPMLLYVPIILLKTNRQWFESVAVPEAWGLLLMTDILVALFIEAIQYTAITTYYLLKKER